MLLPDCMHVINKGQPTVFCVKSVCKSCTQQLHVVAWSIRTSGWCPDLNQLDVLHGITLQDEVPLGNPDVLICSVGTEIFWEKPTSGGSEPQPDKTWMQLLDQGWNRQAALDAAAHFNELVPQVTR